MAAGLRGVLALFPPEPAVAAVQRRSLAPAPDAEPPGHRPAATALAEAVRGPGRGVAAVPLVLAPAALVLGLWGLGRQGTMWRDEAVTYEMAHRGLTALWQTLPHFDAVHGRIVVLRDPPGQPFDAEPGEAAERAVLREHFRECGTWSVRGARVSRYVRSGLCRTGSASASASAEAPSSPSSGRSPSPSSRSFSSE